MRRHRWIVPGLLLRGIGRGYPPGFLLAGAMGLAVVAAGLVLLVVALVA